MSKKSTANGFQIARPHRATALLTDAHELTPDFPLTVLPDVDLAEFIPLDNGMRVRCRSCGAVQDIQNIPGVGTFVPRFQYVYAADGRFRYRTFAHAHNGCPVLTRIDEVARGYEEIAPISFN
jgi:hypothetical protein